MKRERDNFRLDVEFLLKYILSRNRFGMAFSLKHMIEEIEETTYPDEVKREAIRLLKRRRYE